MAEINNALALAVRPPSFDLSTPLLAAAKLREAETTNALQALQLGNAMERRNALTDYAAAVRAKDPNAIDKLSSQPDIMTQVLQARTAMGEEDRKRYDFNLKKNIDDAQEVAGVTDPAERAALWGQKLQTALAEKRIDEPTFQRYSRMQPSDLVLGNIIKQGLTVQQRIELGLKESDRATTGAVIKSVAPLLAGQSSGTQRLVQSESGGNPSTVNSAGYAGLFQFGAPRVADLGIYTPGEGERLDDRSAAGGWSGKKWSGTFNIEGFPEVKTVKDFLANPEAQAAAYNLHQEKMAAEIKDNGLDKFIGKTVGGVQITRQGLENMLHLGGVGGAQRFLESDGAINRRDGNGTSMRDYARMGLQGLPTSVTPGLDRMTQALPQLQLLRMMPGLSESTAKGLDGIIEFVRKQIEPTGDLKEYQFYAQQERAAGREPKSFDDWQINLAQQKATKVTQVNKGEDARDKEMGKYFGENYKTLVGAGDKAFSELGTIATMRQLSQDPNFRSGVLAEKLQLPLKQVIVALGGDSKAAASMETFRSLANKSVLETMGGSFGTGVSNADRDFVVGHVPTLGNTPEGNAKLFDIMEKVARRKIDIARMAQEYAQGKGEDGKARGGLDAGFDRQLSEWREKNPLFSEAERAEIKQVATSSLPQAGDIVDGWKYLGGDRSKRESWERVPEAKK